MSGVSAKVEQGSTEAAVTAYLISHLKNHCENCNTEETPQWRTGWKSPVSGRSVLLCNACGLKFQKRQYCSYCMYIYGNREHTRFFNHWLTCHKCDRMIHLECEVKNGDYTEEQKAKLPSLQYYCPDCRGDNGMPFPPNNPSIPSVSPSQKNSLASSSNNSPNGSTNNVGGAYAPIRSAVEHYFYPNGVSNTPFGSVAPTPYNSVANSAANSAANSRVGSRAGSRRGSWHADVLTPPPHPAHPAPVVTPTLAIRAFEEKQAMEYQKNQKELEQYALHVQAQLQYHAQMQMQLQAQLEKQTQLQNQMQQAFLAQQQQLQAMNQSQQQIQSLHFQLPPIQQSPQIQSPNPIIQPPQFTFPQPIPQNGFQYPNGQQPQLHQQFQQQQHLFPPAVQVPNNSPQRIDSENRLSVSNLLN